MLPDDHDSCHLVNICSESGPLASSFPTVAFDPHSHQRRRWAAVRQEEIEEVKEAERGIEVSGHTRVSQPT